VKRVIAIVIVDDCLCLQEKWGAELVIVRTVCVSLELENREERERRRKDRYVFVIVVVIVRREENRK
jgi:hypothetical protein